MSKIQFLITHNDKGGAQNAILRLANLATESNMNVSVNCIYDKLTSTEIESVIKISNPNAYQKYIGSLINLTSKFKKEKPEIVISFLPLANFYNAIIGFFLGYKVIVSHRNPVQSYGFFMRHLDWLCVKFNLYHTIICNSESVAKSLENLPIKNRDIIKIVNNFVVQNDTVYSRDSLERILNIKLEKKYCLAVGRLANQKRFDILINAVRTTNIQLIIAGDGELREDLDALAKGMDNVHLLGHCDKHLTSSLLSHSHLFLQPSEYEGQSNSLLEAIFCDTIILSSDIPPQREVIQEGEKALGVLISSFSIDAWRKNILEYIDKECSLFSKNKNEARNLYSVSAVGKVFHEILRGEDVHKN